MPTPVGFAEIAVEYVHFADPEPWFNVFGVELDLGNNSAQEAVDHVAAVWTTNIADALSENVIMTSVVGRVGQDGAPDIVVPSTLPEYTGTNTGAMLPQNCAALIRKNTNLGGRRGRGRFFLPAVLPEPLVTDTGQMDSTLRSFLQGIADDILLGLATPDPVTGATTPMVILHSPGQSGGSVPPPTPVETLTVATTIATQRQRLRK